MFLFCHSSFFKRWKFCHSLSCCVENPSVCCSASLPHSPSWHRAGRGRWALGLHDVLIKLTNKLVETKLKQRLISEIINYVKKKEKKKSIMKMSHSGCTAPALLWRIAPPSTQLSHKQQLFHPMRGGPFITAHIRTASNQVRNDEGPPAPPPEHPVSWLRSPPLAAFINRLVKY